MKEQRKTARPADATHMQPSTQGPPPLCSMQWQSLAVWRSVCPSGLPADESVGAAENGHQQDGAGPAVQPLLTRPSEPDSQEVAPPTTSSNRHRCANPP